MSWGAVDQIDGMIHRILKETGWLNIPVIATGGLAKLIAKHSDRITDVNSDLTLQGLWDIARKISK